MTPLGRAVTLTAQKQVKKTEQETPRQIDTTSTAATTVTATITLVWPSRQIIVTSHNLHIFTREWENRNRQVY